MNALAPVAPGTLLRGLREAATRFEDASRGGDSEATFLPLFEALNWTVSLDERLGYPRSPVLRGLRYARNRVHHQWADALEITPGRGLPFALPTILGDWSWRQSLPPGRDSRGEAEYEAYLAGRAARATLNSVSDHLAALV